MPVDEDVLVKSQSLRDTEQSLWMIASNWRVPLAAGCEFHLRHAVEQAAARMEAENILQDRQKNSEAQANLVKLLEEMTLVAQSEGWNELHEPTFFKALDKLCPIWPFC